MSKKLKAMFEGLNVQAAADQVLVDIDSPEERLALMNLFIEGAANPSFDQSVKLNEWLTKQKKAAPLPRTKTVSTPKKFERRPTGNMTW